MLSRCASHTFEPHTFCSRTFESLFFVLNWVLHTGTYHGDSDLQLERINVYYNEATGGRYARDRADVSP